MKIFTRTVCLILCLLFTASFAVSCGDGADGSESDAVSEKGSDRLKDHADSLGGSEGDTEVSDPLADIELRKIRSMKAKLFAFDGDNSVLELCIPIDWSIESSEAEGYSFLLDGAEVGTLVPREVELDANEEVLKSDSETYNGVRTVWEVISSPADGAYRYFHRFKFTYKLGDVSRVVTAEVNYAELDDFALRKFRFSPSLEQIAKTPMLGTIPLAKNSESKPILILGNSFIGSSQVGTILRDMIDAGRKGYTVRAISVGYATVSKSWSDYEAPMRNGEYSAVFMCGFYGASDVTAFETYRSACAASGTPIVIFPAHNEGSGGSALSKYQSHDGVYCLDWKGEIDALIGTGVNVWDFCVNDTHKHSTPLAGYVGAHMIYRAIFGEMPPVLDVYYNVQHDTVTEKLGTYPTLGYVQIIDPDSIYRF